MNDYGVLEYLGENNLSLAFVQEKNAIVCKTVYTDVAVAMSVILLQVQIQHTFKITEHFEIGDEYR